MTVVSNSQKNEAITPITAAAAFRKVVAYNVIDIFDLNVEESIWLTSNLAELESILSQYDPASLPIAVTHEIRSRRYSNLLSQRGMSGNLRGSAIAVKSEISPTKDSWILFLLSPISESYHIPEHEMLRLRSVLDKILSDLGIDDSKNPRGATKIPTELKLLNRQFQLQKCLCSKYSKSADPIKCEVDHNRQE